MARNPFTSRVVVDIFEAKVAEMFVSPEAMMLVADLAQEGAAVAQDTAPVVTGDYRDSIRAEGARVGPTGMAEARFGSEDPTWHLVEFGSATNTAHRTLTNAVEQVGLDFEPS